LVIDGNQTAAWDYSYIGNIEKMHAAWDAQMNNSFHVSNEIKDSFQLYNRHDAIKYILDKSKNEQIVIINEGHHMPLHRVFTTQLLSGLKEQGYTHLGLETYFGNPKSDSILINHGYPTMKSGFYTKEPQFGNMLREAQKNGFKVFGYESRGHANGKEREMNQALNIKKYLEENLEYTGINPLTINQVVFSERSKREFENEFYQLYDHKSSSVYTLDDGTVLSKFKNGGTYDMFVFHPRRGDGKRPNWLIYNDRIEYEFKFEDAEINCPCLVFAYKKGDKIGTAVPYDIQESTEKTCPLILDKSNFSIVILNQEGKALVTEIDLLNCK